LRFAENRGKHLGDKHGLGSKSMCASTRQETRVGLRVQSDKRRRVKRVTRIDSGKGKTSAPEPRVRKEQRTKRTIAEPCKPAAKHTARFCRQHCMSKDDGAVIAEQNHFAYPAGSPGRNAKRHTFIGIGMLQILA